MKQYKITLPTNINTTIDLPASKSISNRALIIKALTQDKTILTNVSTCDDTQVIVDALREMPEVIDIHAAGTAMRFMTAYLAVTEGCHIITGTERMRQRPIAPLVDALRQMGAEIEYLEKEGFPPLRINGKQLEGGHVEIDGNISSQFITALLLIAPTLPQGMELKINENLTSRPYIDLTLDIMHDFGADANWTSENTILVEPKKYEARTFAIESDWSAASYWYEILALCSDADSEIRLKGLTDGSRQGDSVVRYLFSMLGVKTTFGKDDDDTPVVVLKRHNCTLPRLDYDFKNQPDIAQTFVVTCCLLGIPFRFTGLSTLKIKETDRLVALKNEIRKLGFVIREENESELIWDGERCEKEKTPVISTYNDHRMAMPFAAASISIPEINIDNPDVVNKSYPSFWNDLKGAGAYIIDN